MEKTAKQIDQWFNNEVREELKKVPEDIKKLASRKREYVLIISDSVATKKCFNSKKVLEYLDSLI